MIRQEILKQVKEAQAFRKAGGEAFWLGNKAECARYFRAALEIDMLALRADGRPHNFLGFLACDLLGLGLSHTDRTEAMLVFHELLALNRWRR